MPSLAETGALQHPLHLAPQQGDLQRVAEVHRRGVQADEAVLPHHPALLIQLPHQYIVVVHRAMHFRPHRRLGETDKPGREGKVPHARGEFRQPHRAF